jgi:hypothetical protein
LIMGAESLETFSNKIKTSIELALFHEFNQQNGRIICHHREKV